MNPDDAGSLNRDRRKARLAASLRENLKKRKAQQRSRAADAAPAPAPTDPLPSEAPRGSAADEAKR